MYAFFEGASMCVSVCAYALVCVSICLFFLFVCVFVCARRCVSVY